MKLLFVVDVKGWAWWNKATALAKYLSPHFEKVRVVTIDRLMRDDPIKIIKSFDSVHSFGWRYSEKWAKYSSTTVASYDFDNPKKPGDPRKILKKYRGVVTTCQDLHYYLLKKLGVETYCLPNGVDHTIFTPPVKPRNNKNLVVGWVGKPLWRFDRKRFPDEFQYYGQGGIWPLIKAELDKIQGVETRAITNLPDKAVSAEEMVRFYQGIDVFLCLHYKCGTPNPAFEAAACGCSIISTSCGAIRTVLDDSVRFSTIEQSYDSVGVGGVIAEVVEKVKYYNGCRDEAIYQGQLILNEILANWTWEKRSLAWLPFLKKTRWR